MINLFYVEKGFRYAVTYLVPQPCVAKKLTLVPPPATGGYAIFRNGAGGPIVWNVFLQTTGNRKRRRYIECDENEMFNFTNGIHVEVVNEDNPSPLFIGAYLINDPVGP